MLTYLCIALVASVALLIKDWVETKDIKAVESNWKKYVGCLVGGLLYGLLSELSFFRWIAVIAVIYLIGNSFHNVLNVLNWLYTKIRGK
jgi:predicted lipid-binding transport protein (Tim44 family)